MNDSTLQAATHLLPSCNVALLTKEADRLNRRAEKRILFSPVDGRLKENVHGTRCSSVSQSFRPQSFNRIREVRSAHVVETSRTRTRGTRRARQPASQPASHAPKPQQRYRHVPASPGTGGLVGERPEYGACGVRQELHLSRPRTVRSGSNRVVSCVNDGPTSKHAPRRRSSVTLGGRSRTNQTKRCPHVERR